MKKLIQILTALAVMFALVANFAVADTANLEITSVEVNDNEVTVGEDATTILSVEEGENIEVQIALQANADVEDIEVEIEISGYEYDDLEAESDLFDIAAGTVKYVTLDLDLPRELDEETYYLRIRVDDQASSTLEQVVELAVEPSRHGLEVADISLSATTVEAGRSVLTTVELENYGKVNEEDVKVTVAVPALGISASDYIDNIEVDDNDGTTTVEGVSYETTEELFLSIPDCAAAGSYELTVEVEYDYDQTVSESYTLTVTEGDYCDESSSSSSEERLVIAVGPESQTASQGETATFAIALSNEGDDSETFTLELSSVDGAFASLSDSLVVLSEGESQVVYGYVAISDATGNVPVTLSVANEGETIETVSLSVEVEESASSDSASLRNALEIALIVLVVLLVLVGLIIGFTRLRKEDDEEQTYY